MAHRSTMSISKEGIKDIRSSLNATVKVFAYL